MKMLVRAALGLLALLCAPAMAQDTGVQPAAPAGFMPGGAMTWTYTGADGKLHTNWVSSITPLPTQQALAAATATSQIGTVASSGATPTSGSATFASGTALVGPFAPQAGRDIWITLNGTWSGQCQLLRSRDGGTYKLAITSGDGGSTKFVWTGNVNAPVMNDQVVGATYYLQCAVTSGSLYYRLEN